MELAQKHYLEPPELVGFKQKTGQLMACLEQGDTQQALRYIQEINQINEQSTFTIVGKITRGFHNAISDLHTPMENANDPANKNRTRAGLNYVIELTDGAARTTLDKTEHTQECVNRINSNMQLQTTLIKALRSAPADDQPELISSVVRLMEETQNTVADISRNTTDIVLAQNFQDLATQSIRKAIAIISDVENSLVSLTQYTRLLQQLSQIPNQEGTLDEKEKEELRTNLGKMEMANENEHMDQSDVDNLLSSLGF
ncbi:MAG: protein phosphatase CheZ [Pseudomonadota bacterium]|nr:protein phosphatase CheZ [Pseudomonadota bacterium]